MTFFSKKPCSYIVNNILFFMLFSSCLHAVKPQKNEILHKAVLENNIAELKNLLNQCKYDVNEQNQFGFTPLVYAITNNNIETATLLLNQNANLNGPTPDNMPLMFFAVFSGSANMIDFLVSLGVDPSPTMGKIRKPIHTAIHYGHTHLIQKLAESSPIPVIEQAETPSILALSAFYGYDAIVEYYLQKGCKATMIFSDIAPHFKSIPPRPSNLVYFACANNQYTTVKKLLKAGVPAHSSSR